MDLGGSDDLNFLYYEDQITSFNHAQLNTLQSINGTR